MMSAQTQWVLLSLAGMALVWLIGAWAYHRARRRVPKAGAQARDFPLSRSLWWMGPPLIFLGPGLALFLLFLIPIEEKDLVPVFFIVAFMGGLAPLIGASIMLTRPRINDAGLVGSGAWGLPSFIAWPAIKAVKFSTATQSLRFDGGPDPLYVPVQLHDWPAFVAELQRRLPHLPLPAELQADHRLRNDGERLAFEGHWQGLYDHAGRIFSIAALVVVVSLHYLEPHPQAMAWSALGGAGLALYPVLRRRLRKPRRFSATLGNSLQFLGSVVFTLGTLRAQGMISGALGGEDVMTGAQWFASLAQTLGMAALAMAALILLARWRWPERYARQRMGQDDGGMP